MYVCVFGWKEKQPKIEDCDLGSPPEQSQVFHLGFSYQGMINGDFAIIFVANSYLLHCHLSVSVYDQTQLISGILG